MESHSEKNNDNNSKHGKSVSFDSLYDDVGHIGLYQVLMFMILGLVALTAAESISLNFITYLPDHWCRIDELIDFNSTVQRHVSIPIEKLGKDVDDHVYESCKAFDFSYTNYDEDDFATWNRSVQITNKTSEQDCQQGWEYDTSLITASITTKWDLVCGKEWMIPFAGTMTVAGFMIASLIIGPCSERFGRWPCLLSMTVVKVVATIVSPFMPNYILFIIVRVILSIGSVGTYIVAFSILLEIVGPAYRSAFGMGYATLYSCSYMLISVAGYFFRDDVSLQLATAIPYILLLIGIWFVPESPRWLLLNGHYEKAEKVLRKMAKVNGKKLTDTFTVRNVLVTKEAHSNATLLDIIKSPILLKRGLIIALHWFTDSLIFYALSLNAAGLSGDIYMNSFILGAVEVPANLSAIFFMNWHRIGRRGSAVMSLMVAGIASLGSVVMLVTGAPAVTITVLSMFGKAGATMGFNVIYIYTAEVFPTEVRNIALGMGSFSSRISGMAAPYVGGPLSVVWEPLPSLIFGTFGVVSALLSLFLPETLGIDLADTIEEVESRAKEAPKSMLNVGTYTNEVDAVDNPAFKLHM